MLHVRSEKTNQSSHIHRSEWLFNFEKPKTNQYIYRYSVCKAWYYFCFFFCCFSSGSCRHHPWHYNKLQYYLIRIFIECSRRLFVGNCTPFSTLMRVDRELPNWWDNIVYAKHDLWVEESRSVIRVNEARSKLRHIYCNYVPHNSTSTRFFVCEFQIFSNRMCASCD